MTDAAPTADPWTAFARRVIESAVHEADPQRLEPPPAGAQPNHGAFVTLRKSNRLRGCMGSLDTDQTLGQAVRTAALSAAMHDPRFGSVTNAELPDIVIEVSILTPPTPMKTLDELELGKHGILIHRGPQRGLFLPQVATDHHLDKEAFLSRCCSEKAGLPPEAWRDPDVEVLLFASEIHREPPR
jgi:AmmeMemoRadiSam system protein A